MIKDKDNYINPECVVLAEKKNSVNTLTLDSGNKVQVSDEVFEAVTEYEDTPELQNKTVTPTTSQQTVIADDGYQGLDTVTVEAVTSSIDANIQPGNIKKDISILGVTGSYEGVPTGANVLTSNEKQILTLNSWVKISEGTYYNMSKFVVSNPKQIPCEYIYGIRFNDNSEKIDIPDGSYDLYMIDSNIVTGNIKIQTINNIRYLTIYSIAAQFSSLKLVIEGNTYYYKLFFKICYSDFINENFYINVANYGMAIKIGDSYTTTSISYQGRNRTTVTPSTSIFMNILDNSINAISYDNNNVPGIAYLQKEGVRFV